MLSNMINLGIIRKLAKERNMTLKQVSENLGISPATLQNIMRNNATTMSTLQRLADIFDVSVGVFFGEKQDSRYLPYAKLEKYAHKLVIEFVEFVKMITRLRDEMKRGNQIYTDKMLATLDNILEHYNNHIIHPNTEES